MYTDHKTLEIFEVQCDLSRRQVHWMEFMSPYNCRIVYMKGEDNTITDALSCTSFELDTDSSIPYPSDNKALVACVYDKGDNWFSCAYILTDPFTIQQE